MTYVGPIDPAVQAVLNLYANAPVNDGDHGDGTGYYRSVQPEPAIENFVTTRWDYTFSPKNSVFARYIFDTGSITDPTDWQPGGPVSGSVQRPEQLRHDRGQDDVLLVAG